ncbi:MAG: hypothetical protein WBJ03_03530 [Moraxellaceae bacterium]
MKSKFAISFLVVGTIFSTQAMAGDPVVGAIIGGGVGAAVGKSMGGRDGAVVGGMLGAMTGVMIANDKGGHSEPDYRGRDEWHDRYDGRDRTRIVYRDAPTVIYREAPVVVVRERASRVVVVERDGHPGRGHGWGRGHHHKKWNARHEGRSYRHDNGYREYAYQRYDD